MLFPVALPKYVTLFNAIPVALPNQKPRTDHVPARVVQLFLLSQNYPALPNQPDLNNNKDVVLQPSVD